MKIFSGTKSSYPALVDVVSLLGVFLIATVLASVVMGVLQKSGVVSPGLSTFLVYLIQFLLTIAYAMMQRMRHMPRAEAGLKFGLSRVDFTVILWGLIVVMATGIVIEPVLALLPDAFMEALNSLMGRGGWMMLTSIVLAPILEEILFRGILQDALTYKYGAWKGIVGGAAIFGVVHILPQQAINAFLIGLVLGYIYYQTRSLIPVMVIHCLNNAIAYFSWVIGGEQLVPTRQQLGNDTTYYVVYVLACAIFLLAFISMTLSVRRAEKRKASLGKSSLDESAGKVSPPTDTKTDASDVITQ